MSATTYRGVVNEDGIYAVMARITALDGSGDEVVKGEGKLLEEADVSSITCKVYDLGDSDENTPGSVISPDPTVTVANAIYDELQTVGWSQDEFGYNFRHSLGVVYAPTGGNFYLIEYKITLTEAAGNGPIWLKVIVEADAVNTS